MIDIEKKDTGFYDTPSPGDKDCKCSRCLKQIDETQKPIRFWPHSEIEYRYCELCQIKAGIQIERTSFYPNEL